MYGSWKVLRNISEGELLMPVDNCNIFPCPWWDGKKIDISLKAFINLKLLIGRRRKGGGGGVNANGHFDILKRQRDEGNKTTRRGITVTSSLKELSTDLRNRVWVRGVGGATPPRP